MVFNVVILIVMFVNVIIMFIIWSDNDSPIGLIFIICVYIISCRSFCNNGSDNDGSIGLTFIFLFRFDLEFMLSFRICITSMHCSGGRRQLNELGLGLKLGLGGVGFGVKEPIQSPPQDIWFEGTQSSNALSWSLCLCQV